MSISSKLGKLTTDITSAYNAINTKGGTIPANKNTDNLSTAINSIPTGTTPTGTINITTNGTHDVTNYASANVDVGGSTEKLDSLIRGTITEVTTSVEYIRQYCFYACLGLTKVVFTNSTNQITIGSYAFRNCQNLDILDFSAVTQVAALNGQNAISQHTNTFKIIVPDSLYSQWISATNWSAFSSFIVKASEV